MAASDTSESSGGHCHRRHEQTHRYGVSIPQEEEQELWQLRDGCGPSRHSSSARTTKLHSQKREDRWLPLVLTSFNVPGTHQSRDHEEAHRPGGKGAVDPVGRGIRQGSLGGTEPSQRRTPTIRPACQIQGSGPTHEGIQWYGTRQTDMQPTSGTTDRHQLLAGFPFSWSLA